MALTPVLRRVDRGLRQLLSALCSVLLALMVIFIIYTVIMRTVFLAPPFWGETLTLFANIWLVMLAFALAVRDQSNIAMGAIHAILPAGVERALQKLWTALFGLVGLLMLGPGYEAASRILGKYWELGYLPKSYPMMILPVAGALIVVAAVFALADGGGPGRSEDPEGRDSRPNDSKEENAMIPRSTLLGGLLSLAAAGGAAAEAEITLRLGTAAAPSWSLGKMITEIVEKRTEAYSDGRIDVVVHDRGALCSEHACVEQLGLDQIDIATVSSGNVGAFGTTFDIINLPYLFADQAAASAILNDWLADELSARAEAEMGMHVVALVPVGGFRNLVNTEREVRVPADLEGLKIRVTKSPTEFNLVKAWGATPVPYDWSSLYEGLQSGVVQGMYLQDPFTAAGKFYEVVKHVTDVGAAWSAHPILMSKSRYDALPDWAREAIDRMSDDLQRESFEYDLAWQEAAVEEMEGEVDIYEPTPEERTLWEQGAREAWVAVKGAYDPALARRILEHQERDGLIAELEAAGAL